MGKGGIGSAGGTGRKDSRDEGGGGDRQSGSRPKSDTESTASGSGSGAVAADKCHQGDHELSKRMLANVIAAACGAIATALVESPVELFRHQAQVW